MLLLALAAGAARCALPDYCPSDLALKGAVEANTYATIEAVTHAAHRADPGGMMSMHAPRILGISDVYCGDFLSDKPGSITCRLTVRYSSSLSYLVVRISKDGKGWTIHDQLGVSRETRRRR